MRVSAIVNQKGGCGKTTTAVNLAAVLAAQGVRVLLVDLDPQSHCAVSLGVPADRIQHCVGDVLEQGAGSPLVQSGLLWEPVKGVWLAPSHLRMSRIESSGPLLRANDRDRRLSKLLDVMAPRFDWCLIDCPPTAGLLTFNAVRACDELIVPVETGFLALKGAESQVALLDAAVARMERAVTLRILPTMHRDGTNLSADILGALQRKFPGRVAPRAIRHHEVLREAVSFGQPITEFAPSSDAAAEFRSLAAWLVESPPAMQRTQEAWAQRAARAMDESPEPEYEAISEALPASARQAPQVSARALDVVERMRSLRAVDAAAAAQEVKP
ncbi:MAG: ParA family protein [Bacteroidia bacterium]|nr:ParA family protein [Bacteroidia bacterium]